MFFCAAVRFYYSADIRLSLKFVLQVVISLLIARWLTNWLWSKKRDPDMYALPIHSAFIDLAGQLLLVLCFEIVSILGGNVTTRAA